MSAMRRGPGHPADSAAVRPRSRKTLLPKEAPDFSYQTPYEDYDDVLADFAHWETTCRRRLRQRSTCTGRCAIIWRRTGESTRLLPSSRTVFTQTPRGSVHGADRVAGTGDSAGRGGRGFVEGIGQDQADPLYQLVKKTARSPFGCLLPYVGLPGNVELSRISAANCRRD